jgi:hypothetical protein
MDDTTKEVLEGLRVGGAAFAAARDALRVTPVDSPHWSGVAQSFANVSADANSLHVNNGDGWDFRARLQRMCFSARMAQAGANLAPWPGPEDCTQYFRGS